MDAVKHYSAEQLGDMTKIDISQLVGDREGKKLYTQLTIEKSGDCWHVSKVYSCFFSRSGCTRLYSFSGFLTLIHLALDRSNLEKIGLV
jgi:hypothetical protein